MRSALTEQLAGRKPQAPPAEPIKASLKLLSDPAFPCLRYAKGEVVEAIESSGYEETDLSNVTLPGTAPSTSVKRGQVDYELNPYKRRGGEEVVGSSFQGLSSLPKHGSMPSSSLIGGQAIGSLPKGLTADDRKAILQATPMSPSLSLLNSMGPSAAIHLANAEGRALRRSVLRGAIVVFVTAGYSGKRFIFERCKQLGVRSVILDGADSWSQSLVEDGLAEKFIAIDFADTETLFDRVLDACKKVRADMGDLDAVTTFCELAVPLVARLTERLGLPGNTVEAVDTARNKYAARAAMSAAKLPTPKNFLIEAGEQLDEAAEHVGFPAVIKPISGAASIGVVRVDDKEQLKQKYAQVISNLSGARVVAGALVEGSGEEDAEPGNAGGWMDLSIMMEEYLDGEEVDVDLVLSNGETVYGAITDNWPTVEPWFNETGSNCPSILTRSQQMELLDLGIKAVQCMGFELGVFHVELKNTSRGARLIEVNARMGGGPVRNTNLLVWGVDLVEQHVTACCGIPCKPAVAQKPLKELAELTLNAKVTGILEDDKFLDEAAHLEGMLYARPLVKPGAKCVCVEDGLPTWIGEMMVAMSPVEEAIEWIKKVEDDLNHKIRITPKSRDSLGEEPGYVCIPGQ